MNLQSIIAITLALLFTNATYAAPNADAGPDQSFTDNDGDGIELVTLDGSYSTAPVNPIVEYLWTEGEAFLATGPTASVNLSVRLHTITLTVTDSFGNTDTDTVNIRIYAKPIPATLNLSAGFNIDAFCGPFEIQGVYHYAAANDPDKDLAELQGFSRGFAIIGSSRIFNANTTPSGSGLTYSTSSNWFHPLYPTEGTPEDGVITAPDGRVYHIAGVLGNTTYPGNWLEAANPSLAWESKNNAVIVGSDHRTETWQLASQTVELPESQKTNYLDINFILAAFNAADRARNMQIVALYGPDGTDEQILYSFSTEDGGSGPIILETSTNPDFQIIYSITKTYNNSAGPTGGLSNTSGNLYQFTSPLPLDPAKTLWGFRIEDVAPALNNSARGLAIYAASASTTNAGGQNLIPFVYAGTDQTILDTDNSAFEDVTLDASASYDPDGDIVSYVWIQNDSQIATGLTPTLTLGIGTHEITLTVTDNEGAINSDTVTVTINEVPGAKTYYVDYDNGDDNNNGRDRQTPWKHCPGDANATANPAATLLTLGDTVIFKGGVTYYGEIVTHSGSDGIHVTYDGNTAGTFGTGRAIIDGSQIITGWTQCQSAVECGGNPEYADIYWAYAPAGTTAFNQLFFEYDQLLHPAQDPNVYDPFYHDNLDHFFTHDAITTSTITDYDYFTQADPTYWDGSTYVYIHGGNNTVLLRKVTGYTPAANQIQYETLDTQFYSTYAMVNSLKILDTPGEYVVREDQTDAQNRPKVYYRSLDDTAVPKIVTVTVHDGNFNLARSSFVTIKGFKMLKTGDYKAAVYNTLNIGVSDILIDDNVFINHNSSAVGIDDVTNCIVSNNYVNLCKGKGIILTEAFDSSIEYNTLVKNGSTAIDYYWSHDSQIIGNVVRGNVGGHANGITVYLDSSDILIAYNVVSEGNIALTTQASQNITVAYNILDGNDTTYALADWGGVDGLYIYNNVIINGGTAISSNSTNHVAKNNIMQGSSVQYAGGISENNIYFALSWTQDENNLGPGEFMATLDELFVDAANGNYHLKPDSPAIDAGQIIPGLPLTLDIEGNALFEGFAPDAGPYEYATGSFVAAQHIFYNNSIFDNNNPAANANDDNAIATDKQALLESETASFINYTSYDKGINGLIIDCKDFPSTPTLADFTFQVGNDNNHNAWSPAPAPFSITTRPGAGLDGSDRITIIFPDHTITNTWLKVTVNPTANTGLSSPYTFFFGNVIGETGNSSTDAIVDATDEINARNNPRTFMRPADITNPCDHNRDAKVDATDQILSRNNTTTFTNDLELISP